MNREPGATKTPADRSALPAPSRFAQRTWLFDLDNTLHNASPHIFPHINRAMTAYICEHMQMAETEASLLRQAYWKRYGATLLGLMRDFGTDPNHFLHHTHQIPDLERQVIAERGLKAMLHRLPSVAILGLAASVLVGGFALRWCIVNAWMHPALSVLGFG